jgi:hypothetical protein
MGESFHRGTEKVWGSTSLEIRNGLGGPLGVKRNFSGGSPYLKTKVILDVFITQDLKIYVKFL